MARIAPSWMMTLNAAHFSASKPSSSVAKIKCPVEETGRNSVTPSTMPRMSVIRRIGMSWASGLVGGGQVEAAARKAIAAETAEPFAADRGERSRPDPERLEPRMIAAGDAAALKHQPLVARQRGAG